MIFTKRAISNILKHRPVTYTVHANNYRKTSKSLKKKIKSILEQKI